jgi:hypothetical protein
MHWIGWATVVALALFGVIELIGVFRKGKHDTFTEMTHAFLRWVPTWVRYLLRWMILGFCVWLGLHLAFGIV